MENKEKISLKDLCLSGSDAEIVEEVCLGRRRRQMKKVCSKKKLVKKVCWRLIRQPKPFKCLLKDEYGVYNVLKRILKVIREPIPVTTSQFRIITNITLNPSQIQKKILAEEIHELLKMSRNSNDYKIREKIMYISKKTTTRKVGKMIQGTTKRAKGEVNRRAPGKLLRSIRYNDHTCDGANALVQKIHLQMPDVEKYVFTSKAILNNRLDVWTRRQLAIKGLELMAKLNEKRVLAALEEIKECWEMEHVFAVHHRHMTLQQAYLGRVYVQHMILGAITMLKCHGLPFPAGTTLTMNNGVEYNLLYFNSPHFIVAAEDNLTTKENADENRLDVLEDMEGNTRLDIHHEYYKDYMSPLESYLLKA